MHEFIQPEGWARPRGYANGIVATGRVLSVGGQIGWNAQQQFESDDFIEQFAQTLDNVLAVVRAAGGEPEHIVSMTVFVVDLNQYRSCAPQLGAVWRPRLGKHYPAMAMVGVTELVEPRAKVEIQATAVLPDTASGGAA
jgi:enamine deaminase RidA (YjgF/YER057c/UK114 family)